MLLLTVGAMQYQLSNCVGDELRITPTGMVVMLVIIASASGGNIYTQKVLAQH